MRLQMRRMRPGEGRNLHRILVARFGRGKLIGRKTLGFNDRGVSAFWKELLPGSRTRDEGLLLRGSNSLEWEQRTFGSDLQS